MQVANTDLTARIEQGTQAQLPPWPGRLPSPAPGMVFESSVPVAVVGANGDAVAVSGRGELSGPPGRLVVPGRPPIDIVAWAGPWPIDERWWDHRTRRRCARLQVVTADDVARLLVLEGGAWFVEALYD